MGIMRTKVEDGIRQKMVEPLLNWQHNELKYRFSINKTLSLEFGNYIMVVETIYKVIS
jgi:glucuronate isomerase